MSSRCKHRMNDGYPGGTPPSRVTRGDFLCERPILKAFLSLFSSVELDFKQQEDKLQPVLRSLHPLEESQVAPPPYPQETHSSTPKQKPKTESKKHGRWKLWFL